MQSSISNKNPKSGPTYICLPSTSQQSVNTTESQMCAQLQKEFNFQVTQNKKRRIGTINAQINNQETPIQHSIQSKQQKGKKILCPQQLLVRRKKDRETKQHKRNIMSKMNLKHLNKLRQRRHRSKITEEEDTEQKEINKKQHKDRRSKLTDEEKHLKRNKTKYDIKIEEVKSLMKKNLNKRNLTKQNIKVEDKIKSQHRQH